jgi:hypothetical protein
MVVGDVKAKRKKKILTIWRGFELRFSAAALDLIPTRRCSLVVNDLNMLQGMVGDDERGG